MQIQLILNISNNKHFLNINLHIFQDKYYSIDRCFCFLNSLFLLFLFLPSLFIWFLLFLLFLFLFVFVFIIFVLCFYCFLLMLLFCCFCFMRLKKIYQIHLIIFLKSFNHTNFKFNKTILIIRICEKRLTLSFATAQMGKCSKQNMIYRLIVFIH